MIWKNCENFDKNKIRSNFSKAAINYDDYAILQKTVAKKLVELIIRPCEECNDEAIYCGHGLLRAFSSRNDDNINILDLGSGTGFVAQNIFPLIDSNIKFFQLDIAHEMLKSSKLKQENIFNINGDIENLPFKPGAFDLIISSMALQWINNLEDILPQIFKLLKKDRLLAFALPVDDSLIELKQSCNQTNIDLSINDFPKIDVIKKYFTKIQNEKIILYYDDLYQLLKSIKSIGAGHNFSNKTNLTKRDFAKINNFYLKNFSLNNRIACTWHISYLINS